MAFFCTSCGRPGKTSQTPLAPMAALAPNANQAWTSMTCECGGASFVGTTDPPEHFQNGSANWQELRSLRKRVMAQRHQLRKLHRLNEALNRGVDRLREKVRRLPGDANGIT